MVGPDEPFGGRSHQDMEANHWAQLAGVLGGHGIAADTRDLKRLPHDVVLSERLLARVGHDPAKNPLFSIHYLETLLPGAGRSSSRSPTENLTHVRFLTDRLRSSGAACDAK